MVRVDVLVLGAVVLLWPLASPTETCATLEISNHLRATLDGGGARIEVAGSHVSFRAASIRRTEAPLELSKDGRVSVGESDVRVARGAGVVEWWRTAPGGLEHGVTLERRLDGDGELVIEIAVEGDVTPDLLSDDAVGLRASTGELVATYSHLVVVDAGGARVPARMAMRGAHIALIVEDRAAPYPLVVDPLFALEEAVLVGTDSLGSDTLGRSVSISADGTRALVGSPDDDTAMGADAGSARVFVRTGVTWTQEALLLPPSGAAGDAFGWSVALSGDGLVAIVGAYLRDTAAGPDAGAVFLFRRAGTSWGAGTTIVPSTPGAGAHFGFSVASDATGNFIVGEPHSTNARLDCGAAWRFTSAGSAAGWSTNPTDPRTGDEFGAAVALSADGQRWAVGEPGNESGTTVTDTGGVWLFSSTSGGGRIDSTTTTLAMGDRFGSALALSGDGSRLLVGAPLDDAGAGADTGSAAVFTLDLFGGIRGTPEAMLAAPSAGPGDAFGAAVALSLDGSRALVGAPFDDTAAGSDSGTTRVYSRMGTSWAFELALTGPSDAAGDDLGTAVALTSDGSRALVGASGDDTTRGADTGSARVFTIEALRAVGAACVTHAQCSSAFCIDGVCCATDCGTQTGDCRACSISAGGTTNGTCTALSAAVAAMVTCRPTATSCDVPERCVAGNMTCPADASAPPGTICRPSTDVCDVEELCAGGPACPPDQLAASGSTCRASAGPCDAAERCDGASAACPGDALLASGVACGTGMVGTCSGPGVCSGTSGACPGATVLAAGTVCQPAMPGNPCDVPDVCDGSSGACPATYADPATVCAAAGPDVCDAPDHCAGTSADCISTFASGVVCRPSAGSCDVPEACSGTAAVCPPDGILAAGITCRPEATACDPAEVCDGVSTTCPSDVSCDGGGAGLDAASPPGDGGPAPAAAAGCSCRAAGGSRGVGLLGLATLGLWFVRRALAP